MLNNLKKLFKREAAKQIKKAVNIYISEVRGQIIIAPRHINKSGIYYEQEACTVLNYPIDEQVLGDEIIRNFNLFSLKDKNLRNEKLTDWPAFKCSKMKTVKSFKASFIGVSIFGNNYSNISLCIEAPLRGDENLTINSSISAYSNKRDIGKLVMKVFHKSLTLNV